MPGPATAFSIRPVRPAEWAAVEALLRASGLPPDGLERHRATTLVARDAARVVGCVALELYDDGALLRSLAVDASVRGRGLGIRLARAALACARDRGVGAVYLLTETADGFFPRFGFRGVSRDEVPPGVGSSVEFTSACPETARVMMAELVA